MVSVFILQPCIFSTNSHDLAGFRSALEQIKAGVCPGFTEEEKRAFMKITRICSGVTMEICLTMRMSGRLSKKD